MPGGSDGAGAKAGGRFYRNAAFNLSGSLAQLPLDTDSAILAPDNVERASGDMKTLVAGRGIVR